MILKILRELPDSHSNIFIFTIEWVLPLTAVRLAPPWKNFWVTAGAGDAMASLLHAGLLSKAVKAVINSFFCARRCHL